MSFRTILGPNLAQPGSIFDPDHTVAVTFFTVQNSDPVNTTSSGTGSAAPSMTAVATGGVGGSGQTAGAGSFAVEMKGITALALTLGLILW